MKFGVPTLIFYLRNIKERNENRERNDTTLCNWNYLNSFFFSGGKAKIQARKQLNPLIIAERLASKEAQEEILVSEVKNFTF